MTIKVGVGISSARLNHRDLGLWRGQRGRKNKQGTCTSRLVPILGRFLRLCFVRPISGTFPAPLDTIIGLGGVPKRIKRYNFKSDEKISPIPTVRAYRPSNAAFHELASGISLGGDAFEFSAGR